MAGLESCDHRIRAFGRLDVLPEPHHVPSRISQPLINQSVTPHVSCQLVRPVVRIAGGVATMAGARMPKATVNENGQPEPRKHNIWSHGQTLHADKQVLPESIATPVEFGP